MTPPAPSPLAARLIAMYDTDHFQSLQHQRFYRDSGYSNFGYWDHRTGDGEAAGDNLVDELLALLPDLEGDILDVACGQGGTTRRLLRHIPADNITAINISARQLEATRAKAPGVRCELMSATDLAFHDQRFHNIICVEAAFHFETRATFLREAYRVLRPGGALVLSDLIPRLPGLDRALERLGYRSLVPMANLTDTATYRATLADIGYRDIQIIDVREHTFDPFARALVRSCARNLLDPSLWPRVFWDRVSLPVVIPWLAWHHLWLQSYVLVAARKPGPRAC